MIGIDFQIKNEYGSPLRKIFDQICLNNFFWKIESSQVYKDVNDRLDCNLFDVDIMSGKEFETEVNTETYYMIFLTALAFTDKEDIVQISNYSDFEKSKCEIAFICVDNEYISVYSKDEAILEQILNNCKKNNFEKIEIMTKVDDTLRFL